uniref:dynein assembly factor 3, axonemal isoform X3 n=1 Tax=Podarcis muralis TaxID=64176 RepID=UPI0010A01C14|nr:dynein assembly factor 3, axonemal isoform X3 [Podarcis muralis]
MTAAGSGNGFGTTSWWGFSPALDLQATCLEASMEHLQLSQDGIPELNILLVGSVDGRHILKTMSQAHRWPRRKINFYVLENNLEALGRQLLFLSLAVEPLEKMGLQEKSETFLELMGNTLLRGQTAAYLQEKAKLFIRYVTDPDFQQAHLPLVDLSALKFKERDQLEAIFKFWRNPDPQTFQIKQLWDLRLRQYLGARYDSRRGVCDWDLNMKLHEHGKGERIPARGYWGDVATGPYIIFGIEAEDPSLLKTTNGIPSKSSQEISLHNVTALLYELSYNTRYDPSAPSDEEGISGNLQGAGDHSKLGVNGGPPSVEDARVCFLPLNCLPDLHHKGKYQQLFNLIFVSCSMVHVLKPNVNLIAAPKATLIVELTNFLPDLHKEQVSVFSSQVAKQVAEAGFVPVQAADKKPFSLFQLGHQEAGEICNEFPALEMTTPGP